MAYIAKHYIRLNNGVNVPPGQVFEADFDAKTRARLIRLGAIEDRISRVQYAEPLPTVPAAEIPESNDGIEEAEAISAAPEIDVMDGIEPAESEVPAEKKKTGRKQK